MICTNLSKHLKTVSLHIKPKYLSPFENLLLQAPISTRDQLAGVCWSPFPLQSLNSWVLHVSIPPFALLLTLFTHSQDLPGPAGLRVSSFYWLYCSRQTPMYCQPDMSHLLSFWATQWSQVAEAGSLVRLLSFWNSHPQFSILLKQRRAPFLDPGLPELCGHLTDWLTVYMAEVLHQFPGPGLRKWLFPLSISWDTGS